MAVTCVNMGDVEQQLGNFQKALDFYEKALDIFLKCYGGSHVKVAYTKYSIALLYSHKVTKFRPVLCFRRLLQSTQMCMGQIIARQRMHWPKQVSDMVLDQMKFSCTVLGLLSSFTLFLCYVCAYSECHDPSLYADLSHFCMQCYADQDMNVCCC